MIKRYSFTVSSDFIGPRQTENGGFVDYEDYATLQQNLEEMAAENAALKQWANEADELWVNDCDLDSHLDSVPQTPATDAYLNSVRAEAVIEASAYLADIAQGKSPHTAELIKSCGRTVFAYGESLRSGTHDTADKAG